MSSIEPPRSCPTLRSPSPVCRLGAAPKSFDIAAIASLSSTYNPPKRRSIGPARHSVPSVGSACLARYELRWVAARPNCHATRSDRPGGAGWDSGSNGVSGLTRSP
jgi:hypothetical protein